ncbi:MAG: threonine--tRNA ligase [Methanobacteriaceae archaeon]|nr:threonine--tRNA ligase [Methanobacteriaceae archaeon]MDP2836404.1 threonine--tRNA ligase [Methanobacteriaceae archaeon]MDP3035417.1 threonine--tRNA ligase [Methanobacteriaceae archaeon]MDP3484447.1 threonine--tRNA ligase [Methanobacteriaceae archaeon]MDP3622623.1 threonine--tRNA ligase [Methanobacteriaceae archaeon]
MRVLLIHSDYLKYQTKSKTKIAEKIDDEKKKGSFENSLVAFTAVEKEDEADMQGVVENAVKEIADVFSKVGAENVVVYPYAHLSSSLSSPDAAKKILIEIESELAEMDIKVARVPFGWYKSFEVSCKGHPLSELSRTITSQKTEEKEKEKGEESKWYILDEGQLIAPEEFDFYNKDLEQLTKYELGKSESSGEEPPHVKLMKEKGLADYEPSADVGHLRWYPKGRLIRDLLADYVYLLVTKEGAMPVETPIMYDLADDAIRVHAEKFGERQYRLGHKKKELMLRYACCFGAFRVLSDSFLTWKNLPARIYELSTYSFRMEKKGEVVGLKRLRGFTMPDLHTVCRDLGQSLVEFDRQIDLCMRTGEDFNVNYEVIFRATKDFYDEYKEWMHASAQKIGKPVLLEILPERKNYWISKMDFAAIDYLGRPIENPTVQIDVESGERFDITFLEENEQEDYPIILHCSPTGSIERVICSLLEKTAVEMDEKPPMLPVWLSPTQVRILPIAERHMDYALELARELKDHNVRVDVDDRPERVGKKIRNAATDWVPYVAVIGDNELESEELTINIRETQEKQAMTREDLVKLVKQETNEMPFRALPLPLKLSERINF